MTETIQFDSLEDERDYLVGEIQAIEEQMAYRKAEVAGRPPGSPKVIEYLEWKGRAVAAKRHIGDRLRDVKLELRGENIRRSDEEYARRYHALRKAVQDHQRATLGDDYDPTDADLELWAAARIDGPSGP